MSSILQLLGGDFSSYLPLLIIDMTGYIPCKNQPLLPEDVNTLYGPYRVVVTHLVGDRSVSSFQNTVFL
jgi:hypothetical protein